jgi:hypothetical protein
LFNLGIGGEVLVLHGEVHGALEALVAGVHHLPRQPRQGLLDVEVVVGVVQVVVPEPCAHQNPRSEIPRRGKTLTLTLAAEFEGGGGGSSPYLRRREATAFMWRRASGFRRGFTSHADREDSIFENLPEASTLSLSL